MTIENTETKPNKSKAKPAKEKSPKEAPEVKEAKPAKAPAPSAPSASDRTGFEYDFLPLPEAVAAAGHLTIDPKKIWVSKLDARAQPAPVTDDLVASVKENGIIQDPLVTFARDKKTGEEGWLIVAGRRRREASQKAGLKEISAKAKEVKSFKEYLILAGEENLKRQNMSAWDIYSYFSHLMEAGLKQSELKDVFHVTDGYVSQYLAIGKLDERVRKHVRAAADEPFKSHAPTCVRELKRVTDPEDQVAFADQAIAKNLSPAGLKFLIENYLAKKAKSAEEPAKEPKGSRSIKLPEELTAKDLAPLPKSDFAALLNFSRTKYAKTKASEKATPESVAYAKGVMDGLLQASGLKELPTKLQADE
jgi:ParB/RepB/Spo0J family partition protein